jgi:hypothetical protein
MRTLICVMVSLFLVLSFALKIQSEKLKKEKTERQRLELNLNQYGRAISTLTLTNSELDIELQKQNVELMTADSILKSKNRRIKQLEILVHTRVIIRDTDTVYIPLHADPVPVQQIDTLTTLYKSTFTNTKSCITISGFIYSTDPEPSLAITERSTDIKVYDIRIRRRWYQFWRPREERIVESNCGEVEILTINKKQ